MAACDPSIVSARNFSAFVGSILIAACSGSGDNSADNSGNGAGGPKGACPSGFAPPSDMLTVDLKSWGTPIFQRQKSGQIVSFPMPATPAGANSGTVEFVENTGAATPNDVKLEVTITTCAGLILDPAQSPGFCTLASNNRAYNAMTWVAKPVATLRDTASSAAVGYCWAGDPAQYYINARWTFTACQFGGDSCGFEVQHNPGPL